MITTRLLLDRTGTATAVRFPAARTTPAHAATADRGAADHSVTVIATRDGRPMAVAVDSRALRATTAADATTDTEDGGAAAVPVRGPDRSGSSALPRALAPSGRRLPAWRGR
ncbi:hypothetical protein ACIO6U_07205 [Streptomyces sp. NPDC087422]|uniref:hypothetical protein n=1 Tax=Streptomyces sp. NPDC087422 TaxID=3365786 RepID=UPI00380A5D82